MIWRKKLMKEQKDYFSEVKSNGMKREKQIQNTFMHWKKLDTMQKHAMKYMMKIWKQ